MLWFPCVLQQTKQTQESFDAAALEPQLELQLLWLLVHNLPSTPAALGSNKHPTLPNGKGVYTTPTKPIRGCRVGDRLGHKALQRNTVKQTT
jgi:hypothetical protein